MAHGQEFVVFPDIESGKKKIAENKKHEREYFSFGSDDLGREKRGAQDSKFEETLVQGKQAINKLGSLITSSFRNITKGIWISAVMCDRGWL